MGVIRPSPTLANEPIKLPFVVPEIDASLDTDLMRPLLAGCRQKRSARTVYTYFQPYKRASLHVSAAPRRRYGLNGLRINRIVQPTGDLSSTYLSPLNALVCRKFAASTAGSSRSYARAHARLH